MVNKFPIFQTRSGFSGRAETKIPVQVNETRWTVNQTPSFLVLNFFGSARWTQVVEEREEKMGRGMPGLDYLP